jgi:hypothetical protein
LLARVRTTARLCCVVLRCSVLDLLSGFIIYLTARAQKKRDRIKYPQGKSRFVVLRAAVSACVCARPTLSVCE